jgi:methionine-rich copper-binding protein CopC
MRRVTAMLGLVLGAAVLAVAPSAPAFAHNYPVAESPDEGSTIDTQPEVVSLTSNDALLDFEDTAVMDVLGPDGRHYATACATVSGATVEVPATLGTPGDYTVEWQAVSTDGHPISGEFGFTWAPADGVELAEGAATAVCPAAAGEPTDAATDDAGTGVDSEGVASSDLFWVLGAVGVVIVAGIVTWLLVRPRGAGRHEPEPHAPDPHAPDPHEPDPHEPDPHEPDPHRPLE